jgi:hypothetical protein
LLSAKSRPEEDLKVSFTASLIEESRFHTIMLVQDVERAEKPKKAERIELLQFHDGFVQRLQMCQFCREFQALDVISYDS